MPFINGKFYANPAYGRALERGRHTEVSERQDALARNDAAGEPQFDDEVLRNDSSSSPEFDEVAAKQHPARRHGHARAAETPVQRANRIYNETSGLRPVADQGPGSRDDHSTGREHAANVVHNLEKAGRLANVASEKLTPSEVHSIKSYPPAATAYRDSLRAAESVGHGPDPTGGATHFYLDYGQIPPNWAAGKKPVASFGPFRNVAGGGDVPKGAMVRIVILH
ncbi:MAG TPA: hypothetical protein VGT03_06885 [Candidatus Acidoferrales bacterium]|nr:hypothetical protein [Candidatus Acidoferrales bacterium]